MSDPVVAEQASSRKTLVSTLAGFIFPLFFVVCFPLAYVSALHAPAPNDLALTVVGPTAVVAPIAEGLADQDGAFEVTETDVVDRARDDVAERLAVGSILVTLPETDPAASAPPALNEAGVPVGTTVTVYLANGGGRAAASAVQAVGSEIATQLGVSAEVEDVAPLAPGDPLGTALFFLLTYSSIGAYLLIVILTQMFPKAPLRGRYAAVLISSVVIPLFVFSLNAVFVGDYEASFGQIAGLLAVDALYVFTVGSIAILLQSILGKASVLGLMGVVVFLNLPSSGGTMPASMLPNFWQAVHGVWFGSGAFESFRSIIYFDGNGVSRWLPQLLAWAFAIPVLAGLVELVKANRALRRQLDDGHHRHEKAGSSSQPEPATTNGPETASATELVSTTEAAR